MRNLSEHRKTVLGVGFGIVAAAGCGALSHLSGAAAVAIPPFAILAGVGAVAQNILTTRAAERLARLRSRGAGPSTFVNHDVHRVAGMVLLYALRQALTGFWSERHIERALEAAAERWDGWTDSDLEQLESTRGDQLVEAIEGKAPDNVSVAKRHFKDLCRALLAERPRGGPEDVELKPRKRWAQPFEWARSVVSPDPGGDREVARRAAESLAANFGEWFRSALLEDERAFNSILLRILSEHQRLAAETRSAVQRLENPQPRFRSYEGMADAAGLTLGQSLEYERRDLDYERGSVHGTALRQLRGFLDGPEPFRVARLSGLPGMGKSRTALEVVLEARDAGWNAGFYELAGWEPGFKSPLVDTLVVIDDASAVEVALGSGTLSVDEALEQWVRSSPGWPEEAKRRSWVWQGRQPRLRVLVIDRQAWDDPESPVRAERRSTASPELVAATQGVRLEPNREDFLTILGAAYRRWAGRDLDEAGRVAAGEFADRLGEPFLRPLFAILSGETLATGGAAQTAEALVLRVLTDEKRRWEAAGLEDGHLDTLFVATLLGEVPFGFNLGGAVMPWPATGEAELALRSLTSPRPAGGERGLRAVEPPLLGERFVLARLEGRVFLGDPRKGTVEGGSKAVFGCLAQSEYHRCCEFAARAIGDFGATGCRAACEWLWQTLRRDDGRTCPALLFAAAYQGFLSDVAEAVRLAQSPDQVHSAAGGWIQAGFEAADLSTAVERLRSWHDAHDYEPAVRRILAVALYNATVGEANPGKCLAIAGRIEDLHSKHGREPAVRERLAGALYNATPRESDPVKCLAIAGRIEALHDAHGHEPAVREALANALCNATARESDPVKCLAIVGRIEALHDAHGHEPAVREALANALCNATARESDPGKCLAIVGRIEALHDAHGYEPAVREALAKALFNATIVEPDPGKCLAIAGRIEALHDAHGQEPAVRERLAGALYNATPRESDPVKCLAIAGRIEALHDAHGHEPAVRVELARALVNATVVEADPGKRLEVADRIEDLHSKHGREPAVRERLAKALFNATARESDPVKCLAIAGRIEALHDAHGYEPAVREALAKALFNATIVEPDPGKCLAIAGRIEALHDAHGQEPAVREQLAKALCNATARESDPVKCLAIAGRIEELHNAHGYEPAVRGVLAGALYNAAARMPSRPEALAVLRRVLALRDYGPFQRPLVLNHILPFLRSIQTTGTEADRIEAQELILEFERELPRAYD